MANFNTAYAIVHKNESGYANLASDKGGETYCGISRRWHPDWRGWVAVDTWKALHGTPKRGQFLDVPGLVEDVVAFFRVSWDALSGDYIRSQSIANQLYDFYQGTGITVEIAQKVLIGMGFQLTADNKFGPKTLAALNAANEATFFNQLKQARIAYYHWLVERTPSQSVNLNGWVARANRFLDLQKKTPVPLSRAA